jgi:hypothetical protein
VAFIVLNKCNTGGLVVTLHDPYDYGNGNGSVQDFTRAGGCLAPWVNPEQFEQSITASWVHIADLQFFSEALGGV